MYLAVFLSSFIIFEINGVLKNIQYLPIKIKVKLGVPKKFLKNLFLFALIIIHI